MGSYICYSEEESGRAAAPPSPLLAVPNVTAHPSTASISITVLQYDGPLLCGFNAAIKGLKACKVFENCAVTSYLPPTKVFPRLAVNKTILKPRLAAATDRATTDMWDFPDVIKFRFAAHTISEKAIPFQHPDYNPDRAQKLISSSMSRHLSIRNMSSKSMHAFLSNLANRQTETDRQTDRQTNAGKRIYLVFLSEVKKSVFGFCK